MNRAHIYNLPNATWGALEKKRNNNHPIIIIIINNMQKQCDNSIYFIDLWQNFKNRSNNLIIGKDVCEELCMLF